VGHRAFKDRLYAEFATIGKALASAHRLELLDLLGQGERSVDELAQEIGQSLANTSAHLQVLRQARLVQADKRGLNVVYRLAAPEVFTLWSTLRDLGTTRLAEIDRLVETFLTDRSKLAAVDIAELRGLGQGWHGDAARRASGARVPPGPHCRRPLHPGRRARATPG
jgi:DNA-binding transcriptional ArsR family regulator